MQATYLKRSSRANRPASALVGFIVVIALVIVIAFVKWHIKSSVKDPDLCDGLTPWKEWKLRQANPKTDRKPSEDQSDITKILLFDTNVSLDDEPRGEIKIMISPDGDVSGTWEGSYYNKSNVNFDIMGGSFSGMTCPAKTYRDENGQDTSKLYFITKGKFLIAQSNFKKGTVKHMGGDIYVTGWITRDYAAAGKITLTSNEKYSKAFTWKAYAPTRMSESR